VDKRADFLCYPHFDSQRIQETFFSPLPTKKHLHKKIIFLGLGSLITALLLWGLARYEFFFIPRSASALPHEATSLLATDNLSYLGTLGDNENLVKSSDSGISVTVPPREKVGVVMRFEKPQNLSTHRIFLELKKSSAPLVLEVIVKDKNFYSNARGPLRIRIDQDPMYALLRLPLYLEDAHLPNVNFSQIKEVKLLFYRQADESVASHQEQPIDYWLKNWVFIKNVVLVKKEDI
jgi:hypothetical protein